MRKRIWSIPVAAMLTLTGTPYTAAAQPRAQTPALPEPPPLERLFDNRAVSDNGRPSQADFDGAGNSLSAQDLRAAGWRPGQRLDLDAATLRWPDSRPGQPDNVRADGQEFALRGSGDALSLLVAKTTPGRAGKPVTGTGTVRYTDGGSSTYTVSAEDWRGGPLATKAVALPHINTAQDGQRTEKARLYAVTVPLERGRTVHSVRLPDDPGPEADLHVFAAGLRQNASGWTGSWSASPSGYTGVGTWRDQTLRLVVHSSTGGKQARVRLENTFASSPLRIGSASVAVQRDGAASRETPVRLTFDGRDDVEIPAGSRAVSDPVDMSVPADTNLLVSLHLPGPVQAAPVHSEAIQRSYVSEGGSGDRTGDTAGGAYTGSLTTWPFLTGVDVAGGPGSVVALGDSITDGVKSTEGANRRWPDVLARRLLDRAASTDPKGAGTDAGQRNRASGRAVDGADRRPGAGAGTRSDSGATVPRYGVLNQGISANRVVTDRYPGDGVSNDTGGVSAQHRLERDVLAQTGARTVVLFEGINDLRAKTTPKELIAGMRAIAERARERGLHVVAATIVPCGGYQDCTSQVDSGRQSVNEFIRTSGVFDEVLDFDRVLRDPQRPQRMLPEYDSGDHLHPGDRGLRALGDSIDLRKLTPGRGQN